MIGQSFPGVRGRLKCFKVNKHIFGHVAMLLSPTPSHTKLGLDDIVGVFVVYFVIYRIRHTVVIFLNYDGRVISTSFNLIKMFFFIDYIPNAGKDNIVI